MSAFQLAPNFAIPYRIVQEPLVSNYFLAFENFSRFWHLLDQRQIQKIDKRSFPATSELFAIPQSRQQLLSLRPSLLCGFPNDL